MKRITSSVGLVALGAASLHAQYAPGLSQMETSKPWTVSAAVRGFYDDNYATAPRGLAQESLGFEIAPKVGLNLKMDQTLIKASYAYSGKYFEDDSHWDQSHRFSASLDHAFSERYSLKLSEDFSISQEPDLFFGGGGTPLRSNGDNLHNHAGGEFTGGLTKVVGYKISYFNDIYDYDDQTRSLQLDRTEHDIMLAPTWLLQEVTVLSVGARYHIVDFRNNDVFGRNSDTYYGFVGLDHEVNSQLSASARFGFYYVDYTTANESSTQPYADISMTYTYAELSSLQVGFKIDQSQTDVTAALAQASTGGYFVWSHHLAPKLGAKVSGAITSSEFDGGAADGKEEIFGSISAGLNYAITEHFGAEAGYVYNRLDSDFSTRTYSRNRVYLGVTASF